MTKLIEIITENYKFKVRLNDSKTSEKLIKILPVKSEVNRWGDEIYFAIPLEEEFEKAWS